MARKEEVTLEEFRRFMVEDMGITPAEQPDCDPLYVAMEAMKAMKRAFQQVSAYVEMMGAQDTKKGKKRG
ncbi:hypothetical protein SEA_AZIRA_64 [Gordonia phage Azira]|uniref:Uncharacterized protein n=1 Tax=Gordonia phage Azira TaxID=3035369 RepID=A0AAF0K156_9CAUD|nr:hypothetical protein QLQ73_gp64 [Gordonia phage Azira]WGH21070.1 hypothetical protein SEA_AZIRA_64 [Gordonia phage Azira]